MAILTTYTGPVLSTYLFKKIHQKTGLDLDIRVITNSADFPNSVLFKATTKEDDYSKRRSIVCRYSITDLNNRRRMKWIITRYSNQLIEVFGATQ